MWKIFEIEMWELSGLDPDVLQVHVRKTLTERFGMNQTDSEKVMKEVKITDTLRKMSLYAPVWVILTWIVVSFHVFRIVSSIDEQVLEWFPSYRMDL
eukprot:CAMPEP_0170585648 /NCGR_PEP_ID=MMETSP0224-20130122/9326_1 /TAXON_ID=285029 /ORGANISM="Togula jolla, Strain CCCM 725" /LENGTH=96 /DNA_ID=CAMNT_0010909147 /DNA_START=12 /DNA_END=299 /DNA_ORIENTATION=+